MKLAIEVALSVLTAHCIPESVSNHSQFVCLMYKSVDHNKQQLHLEKRENKKDIKLSHYLISIVHTQYYNTNLLCTLP